MMPKPVVNAEKIKKILRKKNEELFTDKQQLLDEAANFLDSQLSGYLKENNVGIFAKPQLSLIYELTVDRFLETSPKADLADFDDPQKQLFPVEIKVVSLAELVKELYPSKLSLLRSLTPSSLSLVQSDSFIKQKDQTTEQKDKLEKLFNKFEELDLNEECFDWRFILNNLFKFIPNNLNIPPNQLPARDAIGTEDLKISPNQLPARDAIDKEDFLRLMRSTYRAVYWNARYKNKDSNVFSPLRENKELRALSKAMLNIFCKTEDEKNDLINFSKYLADTEFVDAAKNFLTGLEDLAKGKLSNYINAFDELKIVIKVLSAYQKNLGADKLLPLLTAAFVLAGINEKHVGIVGSLKQFYKGDSSCDAAIFVNIYASFSYIQGLEGKIIADQQVSKYVELLTNTYDFINDNESDLLDNKPIEDFYSQKPDQFNISNLSEIIKISDMYDLNQHQLKEIGKLRDVVALKTSPLRIINATEAIKAYTALAPMGDEASKLLLTIARLGEMLQNGFTQKELNNLSETLKPYSPWFAKPDNLGLSLFLDELENAVGGLSQTNEVKKPYDRKHLAGLRYGIIAVRTLLNPSCSGKLENSTPSLENFIKNDFLKNTAYCKTIERKIYEFKQHVMHNISEGEDRDNMLKFAREVRQHTTKYYGSAKKDETAKSDYQNNVEDSFNKAYANISTHRGSWFKHMTYGIVQAITVLPIFYRVVQFAVADEKAQANLKKGFCSFFNGSTESEDKARDLLDTIRRMPTMSG